ncbi:MAG TPA: polysaccharide deacetylase family protein [Candidatus Rubrimentiphilum sp.]|nr:polysaccharide deacetylase family protein [Candidatus Rubrimentiphilum sp.]
MIAVRVVVVAAVLAAVGFLAYEHVEQPANQLFGRTVTGGPSNERVIALTYDDGPNPPYTNRILDVLERERVHATFFLVGRAVQAYPEVVRREVRDGDAVGNHSWDHSHLIVFLPSAVAASIQRTDGAIAAATGIHTRLFRPPFGARDWIVMRTARRLGYTVVMWSEPLPRDWEYPSPDQIAQRVLRVAGDGSIVVLHDGNRGQLCVRRHLNARVCDRSADIAATQLVIEALKKRGYRFVTIPELISGRTTRKTARATR